MDNGPCKEVIQHDGFSLLDYPVLHCWPQDGGPFITLPMVFSKNPDTGKRNCGMYRMQVYDERTTGMHWQTHKQGAEHYRRLQQHGQQAHGRRGGDRRRSGDDVLGDSAAAAGPRRDDDRRLPARQAGRDGEVRDLRSRSSRATPKSCSKATSNSASCAPKARSAITPASTRSTTNIRCSTSPASRSASNPIYATTIVGPPPMEDFYMGKAIERIFLPLMRMQLPEVRDICMPAEGVFHNLILVSIRKSYPGHARKVMHAIWGTGPGDVHAKCIVVVDEDVDVQNVQRGRRGRR